MIYTETLYTPKIEHETGVHPNSSNNNDSSKPPQYLITVHKPLNPKP